MSSRTHARAARRARNRKIRALAGVAAIGVIALVAVVAAFAVMGGSGSHTPAASDTRSTPTTGSASVRTIAPATEPVSLTATSSAQFEPSGPATITVSAVGDMIFDRKVKSLIAAQGGLAPLKHVAALLSEADITVGNLESPLSSGGTKDADKDVTFRGDPRGIEGLAASGFDFLALANNHVLDYGPEALADTRAALDGAGIGYAGAGPDRDAAWKPAVREVGGASVAFLSFSHILPPGFIATSAKPGLAPGRTDMAAVADAIRAAKREHDYVLVSFHWGVEYEDYANGDQVRDAHTAVDAGADMVLSHHPHVIQGVEFYNGKLIAYSLGDFVFDHYSRKTGEAFILDASLGPDGVTDVTVTPVYLDGNGAPDVVTGSEATVILERLKAISSPHGTSVVIDGNTARVVP
jgi:poly-gamma-glutamate synthesis protein (capsule biosynthesis protein)